MTIVQTLAVSIAEAVRLTGIGRSSLYEAIRRGDLPIRKSGRRTLLLMEDLRQWVAGLPAPHGSEVRRVNAEAIARALGGRRVGGTWTARCPAHGDRKPSLSIRDAEDGKVLVRCHARCDQERIIAALRGLGLWPDGGRRPLLRKVRSMPAELKPESDDTKRTEAALAIWRSAKRAKGTLVDVYLASRGIRLPAPNGLRFHPSLRHPSGSVWPVIVALVTRGHDGKLLAIHRTYLARDGIGKALVEPQKMMLGPCKGGAVRLSKVGDVLMVGEGIETCLAAMQATGHPAWAALSTSGLCALDLPDIIREVIVLADGDDPGEKAARDAALRWSREGRRVRIARLPQGMDFNDLLMSRSPVNQEDAR
jgi:putative DNA primase/helicase